jgi:putative CocE/NonD family hydrolase
VNADATDRSVVERVDDIAGSESVVVSEDVMVPMRDGCSLATDLFLPRSAGDRPLPAALLRTPYDKSRDKDRAEARFLARHGYLAVVQDCRGRFNSEGTFRPFRDEAQDGFDTVAWLAAHDRCNGVVGTHGCSYAAWVQLQLATQSPEALRTMIVHTGPSNAFHYSMHVGGTRTLTLLLWHLHMAVDSQEATRNPAIARAIASMLEPQTFMRWAAAIPWERGQTPLSVAPAYEDSAFAFYFEHDEYDDFWRDPNLAMDAYFERFPRVPILWITGWYEAYVRSIVDSFCQMVNAGVPDQYLIAGPWTHDNFEPQNGDANYGQDAGLLPDIDLTIPLFKLRWLDRWLRDRDDLELGKPVKVFVMGGGDGRRGRGGRLNHGGRWTFEDALYDDEPGSKHRLYLHESGRLAPDPPENAPAASRYTFDPRDTVHSDGRCEIAYGATSAAQFAGLGPLDQIQRATLPGHGSPGLPVVARNDVVSFQTEFLADDIVLLGRIDAVLYVSSDAPDTDFFVKLVDVYPSSPDYPAGFAFPVTDGALRVRYRNGGLASPPMVAREVYPLEIAIQPAANRFSRGHRIRLDVTSSNFPSFEINHNTGDPTDRSWRIAQNAIHHDRECPSYVEFTRVE